MLGPQCLLTCVNANLAIPDTGHPVYSAALKGCIVTSTGVSQAPVRLYPSPFQIHFRKKILFQGQGETEMVGGEYVGSVDRCSS